MTVLLVLALLLAFVGTDWIVREVARRRALPRARIRPEALGLPGAFISRGHAWVWIEPGGAVRVGVDAFAWQAAGEITQVTMPREGQEIRMGEPLFTLRRGRQALHFLAPVSGRVVEDNDDLGDDPAFLARTPYQEGWVCRLEPTRLASELPTMRIGAMTQGWYEDESRRLEQLRASRDELRWTELEQAFLTA